MLLIRMEVSKSASRTKALCRDLTSKDEFFYCEKLVRKLPGRKDVYPDRKHTKLLLMSFLLIHPAPEFWLLPLPELPGVPSTQISSELDAQITL